MMNKKYQIFTQNLLFTSDFGLMNKSRQNWFKMLKYIVSSLILSAVKRVVIYIERNLVNKETVVALYALHP